MSSSLCPPYALEAELEQLSPQQRRQPLVYVAFLFPAFAGFLFGYDIGATSGAVGSLAASLPVDSDTLQFYTSLLTSASLIGAFAGTFVVFVAGPPLGRRRELLVGGALYLLGTLVTAAAPARSGGTAVLWWVGFGRLVYGLGIAFSMHAAPTYISEISPARVRGLLVSLKEGFIVLGITAGFGAAAVCSLEGLGLRGDAWRAIWALPVPVAVTILIGMSAMPASPRWLVPRAGGNTRRPPRDEDEDAAPAARLTGRRPRLRTSGRRLGSSEACRGRCSTPRAAARICRLPPLGTPRRGGGGRGGAAARHARGHRRAAPAARAAAARDRQGARPSPDLACISSRCSARRAE